MLTLVPAYGNDYSSKDEVSQAFLDDKDFIIQDISSRYDGRAANQSALVRMGKHDKVKIRYQNKTKATILDVNSGKPSN